jgi:hypothetical protein
MSTQFGDLLPAYRDYKTAKEAKEALLANKDWRISSMFHPDCGRVLNLEQLQEAGVRSVVLRFCGQRKTSSVKIPAKINN